VTTHTAYQIEEVRSSVAQAAGIKFQAAVTDRGHHSSITLEKRSDQDVDVYCQANSMKPDKGKGKYK
jgi:hypothetical protein